MILCAAFQVIITNYFFLCQLLEAIENYHITANNIYNVDEKGFLIGIGSSMQRIMNRKAYETGRCCHSAQDGSREFITLIACMSALGIALSPTLLYKGQSKDLQNTWVTKVTNEDDVFFGATENGWTNDEYGMK